MNVKAIEYAARQKLRLRAIVQKKLRGIRHQLKYTFLHDTVAFALIKRHRILRRCIVEIERCVVKYQTSYGEFSGEDLYLSAIEHSSESD